jgi:hypothetical protein
MLNVIPLRPRKNRLAEFIATDWALTKRHARDAVKFVSGYLFFRRNGFTRKASIFNARNAIN